MLQLTLLVAVVNLLATLAHFGGDDGAALRARSHNLQVSDGCFIALGGADPRVLLCELQAPLVAALTLPIGHPDIYCSLRMSQVSRPLPVM